MNNKNRLGPLFCIAFLTMASSAFAANEEPAASGNATSTPPADLGTAPMESDALKTDDVEMRNLLPPQTVIGMDVTNAMGETIGEVTAIKGEQVVVAVGGFLGIGTHDVALNWNQLTTSGDGDDIELHTTLSKDQLKKMPEYKG